MTRVLLVGAVLAIAATVANRTLMVVHYAGRRVFHWVRREVPPPTEPELRAVLHAVDRLEAGGMGRTRVGARLP